MPPAASLCFQVLSLVTWSPVNCVEAETAPEHTRQRKKTWITPTISMTYLYHLNFKEQTTQPTPPSEVPQGQEAASTQDKGHYHNRHDPPEGTRSYTSSVPRHQLQAKESAPPCPENTTCCNFIPYKTNKKFEFIFFQRWIEINLLWWHKTKFWYSGFILFFGALSFNDWIRGDKARRTGSSLTSINMWYTIC